MPLGNLTLGSNLFPGVSEGPSSPSVAWTIRGTYRWLPSYYSFSFSFLFLYFLNLSVRSFHFTFGGEGIHAMLLLHQLKEKLHTNVEMIPNLYDISD